ncbi:MAG: CDP-glycerol glycerophosphotransferase family protein [Spirochaetaceae bacterium]|nr:CDP-glycerol glycerophosphotransferase family protein [Spirochaetaceae bacterium]
MCLFPLYIDPGTGSLLFSALIGAAATLYFVGRALIIKLKMFFSGGKVSGVSSTYPFIIYNEGIQYFNVFKPVLDEFEKREIGLLFLTSAEDDPVFSAGYKYIKPEFIGAGNKAFARLNFLCADVVLMTTPGLNVYQLKRSKNVKHYAHILHAPSDATLYRLFGIDYFDSILQSGDYQAKDIRRLEVMRGIPKKELVTVGCTYLDVYAEKIKQIQQEEHHAFTVLVSPSWGPSALLAKYGSRLLDPLVKTGWRIIVRPHPQSKKSEGAILDGLTEKYKGVSSLEWDYQRENIFALAKADIMISDFSGIVYDYAFLRDKPVIYVKQGMDLRPYDAGDLGDDALNELWQFRALQEIGIELKEEMFASIGELIRTVTDSAQLRASRERAKAESWMYQGEAGRRVAEFMIHKRLNG